MERSCGTAICRRRRNRFGGERVLESLVGVLATRSPELLVATRPTTATGVRYHAVDFAVGVDAGVHQGDFFHALSAPMGQ